MPLIYVDYPEGTFADAALDALAEQITTDSLECEGLPNTPFVRSTVWIYFRPYPKGRIFQGGKRASTNVISFEVNVFQGGLGDQAKKDVIGRMTEAARRHIGLGQGDVAPVYIVFRDVPDTNWGVFGSTITLNDLRIPPADAKPI